MIFWKGDEIMKFVDTHAHLHFPQFKDDLDKIISLFKSKQIEFIVNVGIDVEDSKRALELSKRSENIFCAVGVHPHEAEKVEKDYIKQLEKLAKDDKVVALGEMGLDYYRNLSPKEEQLKIFREQLILAKELDLPVILHIRNAYDDAYKLLSQIGLPGPGGVVHAFSADTEWALKFVRLGAFIGIGGPITYPKNHSLRSVVRVVGIENILSETDCPYLPPQQFRGKRNEPAYVRIVVEKISEILNQNVQKVSDVLLGNAKELFSINF
ncbi:MAG: TatD DNase family protein [Pseudothermotoga sp.]|jgi:TatD DNase family protein|nr:MAG: Hydrolase, TatD family [Pseudothermotoga lettingae]MDI3495290.1 TatD DNase family protein [Pseudothermotoga sp.]MDK2883827.1 TatD DNase family protein [Pseudothermotoga sp.]